MAINWRHAIIVSLALMAAAPAGAQEQSVDGFVNALAPRFRSMGFEPILQDLKNGVPTATPEKVYEAVGKSELPTIDIEITFEYNSAELTEKSKASLDTLAAAFAHDSLKSFDFVIGGHTDTKGSPEYNDKLSRERADAAIYYLILKGTSPDRLVPIGFGERFPKVADGEAAENRRVQIVTMN